VAGGLLAVVALSLLWKHALYTPDGRPVADVRPLNHLVPAYADHFALGALAALAVLCGRGPTGRRAALAGFALFAAGATTAGDLALRGESRALVAAGLACVVLAAATARGGVAVGTLASAPSALLGRRSYGIYLWHYAVLETAFALGLVHVGSPVLVVAAGLLLVSLALAEVSWRLVESPALALAARRRDERPARLDAPDTGGERARPVPYDGSPWHPSRSRSSPATASAPR
jgi:peptidoglycan/LPS O-acetylase OafA/YrhL